MTPVEVAAELYRQIAFSSSILGGFALTFLSILMTQVEARTRVFLTAIGALTTSVVAPTIELGGRFQDQGGGIQYVVPDRSQFDLPRFIEVINGSGN